VRPQAMTGSRQQAKDGRPASYQHNRSKAEREEAVPNKVEDPTEQAKQTGATAAAASCLLRRRSESTVTTASEAKRRSIKVDTVTQPRTHKRAMASINKLSLRGVRAFSPEGEDQVRSYSSYGRPPAAGARPFVSFEQYYLQLFLILYYRSLILLALPFFDLLTFFLLSNDFCDAQTSGRWSNFTSPLR